MFKITKNQLEDILSNVHHEANTNNGHDCFIQDWELEVDEEAGISTITIKFNEGKYTTRMFYRRPPVHDAYKVQNSNSE